MIPTWRYAASVDLNNRTKDITKNQLYQLRKKGAQAWDAIMEPTPPTFSPSTIVQRTLRQRFARYRVTPKPEVELDVADECANCLQNRASNPDKSSTLASIGQYTPDTLYLDNKSIAN